MRLKNLNMLIERIKMLIEKSMLVERIKIVSRKKYISLLTTDFIINSYLNYRIHT